MTIEKKDIVLYKAQDNTDNDSGGGSRTGNIVKDGEVNNLFPDISRIDTVSGRVNLRKVFAVIDTNTTDTLFGTHAMLRKTPTDPRVSSLLFSTDDPHDRRINAQDRVESYVVASYKSAFYLFGQHIAGAKAVTWLQRLEEPLPDVGDVYLLRETVTSDEQYIRVSDIEPTEVTLSYQGQEYKRRRVIATIEQALEYGFTGSTFHPDGQVSGSADTFNTQVADAAKFYGTKDLALDAGDGVSLIKVDSIYEHIVPAATRQVGLVNKDALAQGTVLTSAPNTTVVSLSVQIKPNQTTSLPTPIIPGSISVASYTDDGNGNLVLGAVVVGSVDYKSGDITSTTADTATTLYYQPAVVMESEVQFAKSFPITQENVGQVYVVNVSPLPSMPDVYIDYRANNKWYRIIGNQDGSLGSDPSIGAGQVNDNGDGTATISITLGAVPDVGSHLITSWGSAAAIRDKRTAVNNNTNISMYLDLGDDNIDVTSLSLTCDDPDGGVPWTIDNLTTSGIFDVPAGNGNVSGYVDPLSGVVHFTSMTATNYPFPDAVNDAATFTASYNHADRPSSGAGTVVTPTPAQIFDANTSTDTSGGVHVFDLGSLLPSGEQIDFTTFKFTFHPTLNKPSNPAAGATWYTRTTVTVYSDESGNLYKRGTKESFGTITAAGILTLSFASITLPNWTPNAYDPNTQNALLGSYVDVTESTYKLFHQEIEYGVMEMKTTNRGVFPNVVNGKSLNYQSSARVMVNTVDDVIGEATMWLLGSSQNTGTTVYTRSGNVFLVQNNQQIGSFNNTDGVLTMQPKFDIYRLRVDVISLFTATLATGIFLKQTSFRTSTTKLVTSSLQLRYESISGSHTATSDSAGTITGVGIDSANSYVDTETGMVQLVTTEEVKPDTIKYDAVATSTIPLDPDLLGLNPVRLPIDGRVPIFSPGTHIAIFNEESQDIGTPTAGQTIAIGRDKLAFVEIIDVNGARLDWAQFTIDLEVGSVTMATPLDLIDKYGAPLTPPLTLVNRIEDMVMVTEALVNGDISLSAPLSRPYPALGTKVASLLVWGDVQARAYNMFSQITFDGWFDEPTQDPTTAKYDEINYPIEINNEDSTAGRWMVQFVSSTNANVVSEKLGVVLSGITVGSQDIAPINPATSQPYFTMRKEGWGSGWETSNIVRFNTDAGSTNMWMIRTILSGTMTEKQDEIELEIRGDVN